MARKSKKTEDLWEKREEALVIAEIWPTIKSGAKSKRNGRRISIGQEVKSGKPQWFIQFDSIQKAMMRGWCGGKDDANNADSTVAGKRDIQPLYPWRRGRT